MNEKILNIFDGMAQVLLSPEKFFQEILDKKNAINGLYFLTFFAAFLGFMAGSIFSNFYLAIVMALLFIILAFVKILIWGLICYILAKFLFKGEGSFLDTFGLLGFTSVTYLLGIFGLATMMVANTVFSSLLLWFLMVVWIVILGTVAVDKVHRIGIGKSFLSAIGIPALVIIVIGLIVGVL